LWVEWICSAHWKLVPVAMRKCWQRAQRRERKSGEHWPKNQRLWSRVKREAIERNFVDII
jgi:hypothetical protein